ncbi:iron donor protein CyaY [Idiomarina tyrosinivorans]|uniref:Iron-sulfur cluster assembly protein CyaY n=1 Tax=Idiomarina tyrosinivorans TaxID=1445662 RepID=A0A432ZPR0_9GAMM|nr:iron donor protein CyaY [Idiomarina tyrosinivorans]RUO79880.1 iron donor protein CyaY [Idiomarina tyrosinivorans]
MNDNEYHELADQVLLDIEEAIEDCGVDIDFESGGDILELTFPNNTKMVINKQPPLQQVWVATKFNGHHFEYRSGQWIDNRTGSELWALLSDAASKQAETEITLAPQQ